MQLDGRIITIEQIRPILAATKFNGGFQPKFPVFHNTSEPDIALYQSWMKRGSPTPEQWLKNLAGYYSGLGWNSMPHAFVLPDGRIGLGAPFNVKGTHSPSWNAVSIGVEHVGEFERETFVGTMLEKASVALFAEMCLRFNWSPADYVRGVKGIHFHKEDPNTTHRTCPGRNVDKPTFLHNVEAYMGEAIPADINAHVDVPMSSQTAVNTLSTMEATSVSWVQQMLNLRGAKLKVDGVAGVETKNAVREFQSAHGLVADGIAGPLTRMALKGS